MKVVRAKVETRTKNGVGLGSCAPGEIVHFAEHSLPDLLVDDQPGIYMVVNKEPKKAGRVTLVSLDGKSLIERDSDRLIKKVQATLHVLEEVNSSNSE